MTMRLWTALLPFCCLLGAFPAAAADPAPADPALHELVKATGLAYRLDDDGTYVFTVGTTGSRTQNVSVEVALQTFRDNLRTREVRSIAYIDDRPLSMETALRLLGDNYAYKIGAWGILAVEKLVAPAFIVRLAPEANAAQLTAVIQLAAVAADALELELTGEDVQ